MKSPEEQQVAFIPRNFIERGTIMGGTFKIRNVIEGGILAVGITIPVLHLPLSLTIRIIILCMTALPAAMVSLIGISGESLTAFLMNALRFLKNRRMIYRSDIIPDPAVKQRRKPRNKEPKAHKRKRRKQDTPSQEDKEETPEDTVQASPVPVNPVKKKERREFDVSTKHGIKKQAREDIRVLKFNLKEEKRYQKALHKAALQKEKQEKRRQKAEKRAVVRTEKTKGDSSVSEQTASVSKKKRRFQTLEDYLPIEKIANGVIYTTDHRYVKILEIEPINFLLRSTREQQGIIYSFISYLKISPVKVQIKMISKKADINKHLAQAKRELDQEENPRCRELQEDYIQFVQRLSSREAVSRRFFLIFEHEPFNVNRKESEKDILSALETVAQTAKTFLSQCGNEVITHDNEDEFTTEVLYTLLNRSLCAEKPLPRRINEVLSNYAAQNRESDHIRMNEFLSPESLDFKHSSYVKINGVYHSYLMVPSDGYKNKVVPGWLSLLINAGEGIDIDFYLHKQPKDKIQQRLGQQIRINRSKLKDASDTNSDFDDLDSAIRSGYYLKQGLANNEDFYYINLLVTITASSLEELQWRIQEMKKLLISQDMDLRSCYFLQERGFLSTLPLAALDKKLFELSKRNVLTSGAASCYPFTSYSICDDNGILFGVNKHNNSLVIADIFDSKQYKNSNICILGCSGAGKTFTMQTMALRMRRKGIQVFIVAPLKGHEFYRACKNVGGEFIQISPGSQSCINIMEIRKIDNSVTELLDGPSMEASLLAAKIQKLHIFFSLLIPDMSHEEKQLLDESLIKTYARFGITHKNESLTDPRHPERYKKMPILEDLYNILIDSEDTIRLAHILNRLVHGSAASFNQETNVDLSNKYTVLDISELTGTSDLLTVGMFVALDFVWDKAKENRTAEKAIFVDEVWQLIGASSNRLAAEFVLEIAKIIRAYSGAGIFATQDLNDFFALDDGKYGKGIINNCKTKIVLNMEDEEAQRVQSILHLSETEIMNITHFQRGNGLISTNNNNITVEFKASALEKELITTDRQELLELIERQKKQRAG
ncbi:MAG: ATP-binding protein [Eubacteriales bacterium]|nr:ATP-binding protein [Eubacteriales bacterium]